MTLHDSHLSRLGDPALRGHVLTVIASLAILFVVQFDSGSVAAAGVPVLCGVAGLLLRWTAMPVALVITLGYFLIFPVGLPFGFQGRAILRDSYWRLDDLLLVMALIAYLSAQYRLFDLTIPNTSKTSRTLTPDRSADTITRNELTVLAVTVVLLAVAGQILWWLLTNLEIHTGSDAPLRWKPDIGMKASRRIAPSTQSAELNRFVLLVFGFMICTGLIRFALWYLRLQRMQPAEGRLILLDTQWRLDRRELARLETWRAARRGTLAHHRTGSALFRGIVRSIVLAMFAGFLAWILSVYFFHR